MDLLEIWDTERRLSIVRMILEGSDVLFHSEVSDTPATFGAIEQEEND